MRRFTNNNPFASDSDSDNDINNTNNRARPQSQPKQPTGGRSIGMNPFDEDNDNNHDIMEPPSLTPQRKNNQNNAGRPPKGSRPITANNSSANIAELSNQSGHGISRWFRGVGSAMTPDSSQHGKDSTKASSSEDLTKLVARRLGDYGSSGSTINSNPSPLRSRIALRAKSPAKSRSTSRRRRHKFQQWPYDDYHKEQQKQYAKLGDSDSLSDTKDQHNDKQQMNLFSYLQGSAYNNNNQNSNNKSSSSTTTAITHLYERPPELPGIKETVYNLPLLEFEKVAEQRAIHIVSTFLFDSGLIDELLVNGGMTYKKPTMPTLAPRSDTSINQNGNASVGVEIGMNGYPVGENSGTGVKIEKEINRLRANTQRQLANINHKLNDGVATSGAEVQELVNAVLATKGDLGRLRELSTYAQDVNSRQSDFILTNYPKLKSAMNARRNLERCFRELEFFAQIPTTCDRLREDMHAAEYTKGEWSTLRNVCMEHVDLQILLIEANAGMKARIRHNDNDDDDDETRTLSSAFSSHDSYEAVDRFLQDHINNVYTLGTEIENRVLLGIENAFELSINNPAGMVALCEAVEVYEHAEEQFMTRNEKGSEKTRFMNIRANALARIYGHFEARGHSVFKNIHEHTTQIAGENDSKKLQFSSILRGATELVAEIDLVKHQMSPCFPPHWRVEVLWASCVSHVCSNQIIQQIGGPSGDDLEHLSVTQLLDLVAWIEYFQIHIEESFPKIKEMKTTEETNTGTDINLFTTNKIEDGMRSAKHTVAWANNMLLNVHSMAQEEFLSRTKTQTEQLIGNVYSATHEEHQTADGRLGSSLCEDIFSLVGVQLRTIREHLSPTSNALVSAVRLVFAHLRQKQYDLRDNFLNDLESCCASANDFSRMSEKGEDVLSEILEQTELSSESVDKLESSSSELIALYSSDAVFAAQSTSIYIFEPIEEQLLEQFFTEAWENDLTGNELSHILIKTLEDFMQDLERFMDSLLVKKTVEALVTASVTFYIKCLLVRAEAHKGRDSPFSDLGKALDRFSGDVAVIRAYFESLVSRNPLLARIVEREFEILTTIHEVMSIASGIHEGDASDFVLIIHKKIANIDTTKHLLGDLWHLMNPREERTVWDLVERMEKDLVVIVPETTSDEYDRNEIPGLKLKTMLKALYKTSKRKLPTRAANWTIKLND